MALANTQVANFVAPLSQFELNESNTECVAFGGADIFYCGPPGGQPTGTAEDIDQLADKWFGQLEGGFTAKNNAGMSLQAEYDMLAGLGLAYFPLAANIDAIRKSLATQGLPILLCAAESSFFDTGLGRIPYAWDSSQYNHCIVVCGETGSGDFYVRDYANLEAEPGSVRVYAADKMRIISATAVRPSWVKILPAPVITLLEPTKDDEHVWNLFPTGKTTIPFDATHGIPQAWLVGRWKHGYNFGSPMESEQDMTEVYKSSHTIIEQQFTNARASWHGDTGLTTWYDARGKIADL